MTDTTTSETTSKTAAIRDLNDAFRRSFIGGVVMVTAGVEAIPPERRQAILQKVRAFEAFTIDNDPHEEHDFGQFEDKGVSFFWKIDHFDRDLTMHSPDAADPSVTTRVLTIMLADEY
jgi:hypothetical protein